MVDEYLCIGKATDRQDAADKVTGRVVYAGDIYLPGMLYGVALRSPHPHARILSLDTAAALALPGVRAVLTAADVPRKLIGERVKDMPVLAADRVRYVGEKVAVVAAVNEATARRAIQLIKVEYEPLPAVFEALEAMAPGAPVVHEDLQEYSKHQMLKVLHRWQCIAIIIDLLFCHRWIDHKFSPPVLSYF